jgi:hypoxanthine-DNA glycosylase
MPLVREDHPYGEFIPKKARAILIGSFPIGKFTDPKRRHEIKTHELDFFFGGEKNLLWKLLGEVFSMPVQTSEQVKKLLVQQNLAVGDVIRSCRRLRGGASDSCLMDIVWNKDLLRKIRAAKIRRIYFTSKKVENWFHKLFPDTEEFEKITLISPSAQSVRSLSRRKDFQDWRKKNPRENFFTFILQDYKKKFETGA